jgi:hypothetical protein
MGRSDKGDGSQEFTGARVQAVADPAPAARAEDPVPGATLERTRLQCRAVSEEERKWCLDLDTALERAIIAGEQVLEGHDDRSDRLTVRKRPGRLF